MCKVYFWKKDLDFHYGDNWLEGMTLSPATKAYVDRITQIGEEKPELLVAHAYTRYLGDLSGGQILKKIAQRGMGLKGSEGLAFYEFDEINDESQFKIDYKAALDSLPIKENDATNPITPYGEHKLLAEKICEKYANNYGLKSIILRPFSVYGAGQI